MPPSTYVAQRVLNENSLSQGERAPCPPPGRLANRCTWTLLVVEDAAKTPYVVCHATDSVSKFQAASVVADKSTAEVTRFFCGVGSL